MAVSLETTKTKEDVYFFDWLVLNRFPYCLVCDKSTQIKITRNDIPGSFIITSAVT